MLTASQENTESYTGTRYFVHDDGQPISYAAAIARWRTDELFRSFFTKLLAESPFSAFRWETPALSLNTQNHDFQFVLLDAPSFADRRTDSHTFKSKFTTGDENCGIVRFSNLSADATMVVPSPRAEFNAYGHLAAFLRCAPENQIDALWRVIGETAVSMLGKTPFWLNTAGGGVAWLHVRFDSRPKYYGFTLYKNGE